MMYLKKTAEQLMGETPEKVFEDGVKQVIDSYMQSKFPYVVKRPGFYNLDKVAMDTNSAVMSYNLTNSKGEVVGSIPILFSQGKVRKPWAIFVPGEERMINLSERFLDKLLEVSEDYSGSVASWSAQAPSRALYMTGDGFTDYWMTPKRLRAMLSLLPSDKLTGLIKTSHKNASVYFKIGRVATKVAAQRFFQPVKRREHKEVFTVKQGGLVVSSLEELSRVCAGKKVKRAALQDIYSGKTDVYITGDPMGELIELPVQKDAIKQDFFVSNIYIDVLAKEKPVIPGIHRETGDTIFLIKRDSLIASQQVGRDYLLHAEAIDDDIVKRWNKPEHCLSVVSPSNWKSDYAAKLSKLKVTDKEVEAAVQDILAGKKASLKSERRFFFIPVDPDQCSGTDYGFASAMESYKTSEGIHVWGNFSPDFEADIKSFKDGILTTRYGEEFVLIEVPASGNEITLARESGIYIAAPDAVFKTKNDAPGSPAGKTFLRDALSMDDAAKTTAWIKKEAGGKFIIGIGERTGNMTIPRSLGMLSHKEASFIVGMLGGEPSVILDGPWTGIKKYASTSQAGKKIAALADAPGLIKKIVSDLGSQARFADDAGGKISVNIETLNINVPDLISKPEGQTTQAQEVPSKDMQELAAAGLPAEVIAKLKEVAASAGLSEDEAAGIAVDFIADKQAEGIPEPEIIKLLIQEADKQIAIAKQQPADAQTQEQGSGQTLTPDQLEQGLKTTGVTDQTISLMRQLPAVTGSTIEDIYITAGKYAENAMQTGGTPEQINAELQNNAQVLLNNSSPEMAQAAAMPEDPSLVQQEPLPPEQEQAMIDAGQQVTSAMPQAQPMPTPMYDTTTNAAMQPGMQGYQPQMNIVRDGSLIADIISNATIKSKFLDYLPALNSTIDAISELILKIELSRNKLIDEVGTSNLDSVSEDLRQVADLLGNLVLKIASFE